MSGEEFLKNCTACGGNWTAMLLSGIKRCYPEYYKSMEDKVYSLEEVLQITTTLGVDWTQENNKL